MPLGPTVNVYGRTRGETLLIGAESEDRGWPWGLTLEYAAIHRSRILVPCGSPAHHNAVTNKASVRASHLGIKVTTHRAGPYLVITPRHL